jgi:hypothetical protein
MDFKGKHAHPTRKPSPTDLVLLRFAIPSKMTTLSRSEVFVRTCAEGVIRIPKSLVKAGANSKHVVFEARLPRDVAAAVRSIYGELFRLHSVRT